VVGLTSISFRELGYREIIDMCDKNKVDLIEWGGDIHVPPGNLELAKEVGRATRSRGIKTLSYGSYYQLSKNEDIKKSFSKILDTAEALGCHLIRIWAGDTKEIQDVKQECEKNIAELKIISAMAAERNMVIGLEYHRHTLTETKEMTLKLLQGVSMDNLCTYWQPNPDISHEERLEEIRLLQKYICNVHVFYWVAGKEGDIRMPLSAGRKQWSQYWDLLRNCNCPGIIEFVKGDKVKQFEEDIQELKGIIESKDINLHRRKTR